MSEEHHLPRKKAKRSEDDFASYAWRLIGTFRTAAGWLDLTAGRLRFSTPAEVVFDVPLAEVTDIIWPWYYFGGGVKLSAGGKQYRFSFVLPNGAEYPTARLAAEAGDPAALAIVWRRRPTSAPAATWARSGDGGSRPLAAPPAPPLPRSTLRAGAPAPAGSSRSPTVRRSDRTCW